MEIEEGLLLVSCQYIHFVAYPFQFRSYRLYNGQVVLPCCVIPSLEARICNIHKEVFHNMESYRLSLPSSWVLILPL